MAPMPVLCQGLGIGSEAFDFRRDNVCRVFRSCESAPGGLRKHAVRV